MNKKENKISKEIKINKKSARKNYSNQTGITLIALVVTIVALLILAGVSINAIFSENGIIEYARNAKAKTGLAEEEEKTKIGNLEDLIGDTLTGIKVEKVQDEKPGELEKENDTTFVINSIEDLVVFSYMVTSGNDTFVNKTVKLGQDLDFNSTKSYISPYRKDYAKYGYNGELKTILTENEGFKTIGIATADGKDKSFQGTFDGNNHTIYNLYMHIEGNHDGKEKRGLFASNFGTIKDLKLKNVNLSLKHNNAEKNSPLGAICAVNASSGQVNNCYVSGKIQNDSVDSSTGGIAGFSSGIITNCGNMSDIKCIGNNNVYVGGIAGNTNNQISKSYNIGKIYASGKKVYVGGIIGSLGGNKCENCFNTGDVTGICSEKLRQGGIIGVCTGNVSNCYSIGKIVNETTEPEAETSVGLVIGKVNGKIWSIMIYCLKQEQLPAIGNTTTEENIIKTESEMKTEEFLELLNTNQTPLVWELNPSKNNGYPNLIGVGN